MKSRILVSTMTLSFAAIASAADISVPQDAATIQAAIDLAQDGDRVLVSPGTYTEQINFAGKNIILESTDGAETTTIDGGGNLGFVINMNSGEEDVLLRGFTVTGGFGEAGSIGAGAGGGLLVEGASITIENAVFTGNAGVLGGGVSIIDGDAVVRESRFEDNQALHGGGLYIEQGTLLIEESEFENNAATNNGGAVAIFWLTDAAITDTDFTNNDANSFGGAVYTNHAEIDFNRLSFTDNGKAEEGEHNAWTISTFGGGAVYTTDTNGRINASRFVRNVAFAGGGLYVASTGTVEVVNSLFTEHGTTCGNCGYAPIYVNSSSPTIINCTIADNSTLSGIFTTFNGFPTIANTIISGPDNATSGNGLSALESSLVVGTVFAATINQGSSVVEDALLDSQNDSAPLAGSPSINAGDNSAVPADITTDLLGNPRIVNGTVDIGAIEFGAAPPQESIAGDMNGDGSVGAMDLLMFLDAWGDCHGHCPADLNADGRVDGTDLLMLLNNWG